MRIVFNRQALKPGYILHARGTSRFSRLIVAALSIRGNTCWGSHDALVCRVHSEEFAGIDPGTYIGDAMPVRARLSTLDHWEAAIAAGTARVRIYRPRCYAQTLGQAASDNWILHVRGRLYDFAAFPRLLIKAWLGDRLNSAAGWCWANWCTEGVAEAWRSAGLDLYHGRNNPTPLSSEHEVDDIAGSLRDVTPFCLVDIDDVCPVLSACEFCGHAMIISLAAEPGSKVVLCSNCGDVAMRAPIDMPDALVAANHNANVACV